MTAIKPTKSHYSELEAAIALGVSVEQLRTLIRSHIVKTDDDMANVPTTTFQPSDLLILRMILNGTPSPGNAEPVVSA